MMEETFVSSPSPRLRGRSRHFGAAKARAFCGPSSVVPIRSGRRVGGEGWGEGNFLKEPPLPNPLLLRPSGGEGDGIQRRKDKDGTLNVQRSTFNFQLPRLEAGMLPNPQAGCPGYGPDRARLPICNFQFSIFNFQFPLPPSIRLSELRRTSENDFIGNHLPPASVRHNHEHSSRPSPGFRFMDRSCPWPNRFPRRCR